MTDRIDQEDPAEVVCPFCGEAVDTDEATELAERSDAAEALVCPHCHEEFDADQAAEH